jgi:hypothetical protein
MRLQRWRCGACCFEWFEPLEFNLGGTNINHGCSQGCDDAGKSSATAEAADNKTKWICWILSKEDIYMVAEKAKIKPKNFTEDDYRSIAKSFIKGLEWVNEDWAEILEDAIKDVVAG